MQQPLLWRYVGYPHKCGKKCGRQDASPTGLYEHREQKYCTSKSRLIPILDRKLSLKKQLFHVGAGFSRPRKIGCAYDRMLRCSHRANTLSCHPERSASAVEARRATNGVGRIYEGMALSFLRRYAEQGSVRRGARSARLRLAPCGFALGFDSASLRSR